MHLVRNQALEYLLQVLLLEAGSDETEISDVPALAAYLQLGRMDWKYKTEPQPDRACLGRYSRRKYYCYHQNAK